MKVLGAGAAILSLVAFQRPVWQSVSIQTTSGLYDVDPFVCRWDKDDRTFRRGPANRIELSCDSSTPETAVLQCDAPGFEPRDFAARALCSSPKIVLDEGTLAIVNSPVSGNLQATWLRWKVGPSPDVRAARQFSSASTISVMSAPESFVRFSLGEFSPHTVPSAELSRASPWPLEWVGGGELFLKHERGVIVPDAVDGAGPKSFTATLRELWAAQPNLTAGTYALRRVYAGGIRTRPVDALVDVGRTTDAGLPLEDVGGMRLNADPAACRSGDRLQLFRKGQTNPTAVAESRDCRWLIAGLTPGAYLLALKPSADCAPEITRDVTIAAQQWTEVSIAREGIVVCGQVTLFGEPLGNMLLTFDRDDGVSAAASVTTNASGRYTVALDQPGTYDVSLITRHDVQTQQIAVSVGTQQHDVRVKGGKIILKFPDPPGRTNVALWIDAPSGRSSEHFAPTTSTTELIVFGYGKFGLGGFAIARPGAGKTIERYESFEVSAEKPVVRLELRFANSGQELEVVDPSRRPAIDVQVGRQATDIVIALGRAQRGRARGPFNTLDFGIPMGTPLELQSGEGRTCHVVTTTPREQVVIAQPTGRIELRFPKRGDDLHGRVSGIPGSTCAVPLSHFSSQRTMVNGREVVFFLLPDGALTLERDGRTYPIRVPGPGVTIR